MTTNIIGTKQSLDHVRDYYCAQRVIGSTKMSIYEIWEAGGAFHDSVTPAAYSVKYRQHIVQKLLSLTVNEAIIFSVGCGNGFVEAELVRHARRVRAIDCNEEAVELTARKGVEAFTSDFFALDPTIMRDTDALYADGLIGHLYDPLDGLTRTLNKLRSLNLKRGALILFSNDPPRDPSVSVAQHERVEGFWFISAEYLQACLLAAGFDLVESYHFPYMRPVSGRRNRMVCIAQVR